MTSYLTKPQWEAVIAQGDKAHDLYHDQFLAVIREAGVRFCEHVGSFAERCESPIEFMFLVAAQSVTHHDELVDVGTQLSEPPYRIDAVLWLYDTPQSLGAVPIRQLAVELDGHDFHEKTKAQAARDKRRDRDLQAKGYRVIRFAGSEIYRDAVACAEEAVDHLMRRND